MYVGQMMDLLALRIQDPNSRDCSPEFRLRALNNGQTRFVNLINKSFLTELHAIESNFTLTSGVSATLTAANLDSGRGVVGGEQGVFGCRVYNATGTGTWLTRSIVSGDKIANLKSEELSLNEASLAYPKYHLFENKIYVRPTSVAAIDVFYCKKPDPLLYSFYAAEGGSETSLVAGTGATYLSSTNDTYNGAIIYSPTKTSAVGGHYFQITDYTGSSKTFTTTTATVSWTTTDYFWFVTHGFDTLNIDNIECEINDAFHEIIVAFAEAECWARLQKSDKRNEALNAALGEINAYNASVRDYGTGGTEKEKA